LRSDSGKIAAGSETTVLTLLDIDPYSGVWIFLCSNQDKCICT